MLLKMKEVYNMKKFLALILTMVMVLSMSACGGSTDSADSSDTADSTEDTATDSSDTSEASAAKVFLSISLGGLGDNGYNDSAYAGAEMAVEELEIDLDVYEPTSIAEIEAQMMTVAASGEYDLILGIGADNASAVEKAAEAYPDQAFAAYQTVIDLPNVLYCNSAYEQAGYQLGVMCALLYQANALPGVEEGCHKVGYILGTSSAELYTQVYALEAGGLSVDPEFEVIATEVGNWNDQAKAKELAAALYDKGCGIVMQGAGTAGFGLFEAAKEYGLYAIGSSGNQNDLAETVICSRMEKMEVSIYEAIRQYVTGEFTSGGLRLGIESGVCYNDWEGSQVEIPEDIMAQVEEVGEKLASGEITDIPMTEEAVDQYRASLQ